MEVLNQLFNQIFGTSNINYAEGKDNILTCRTKFIAMTKEDNKASIPLKVFLYFFPVTSNLEVNSETFWFTKYRDDNKYDEYDFAISLLQSFLKYLLDKDQNSFDLNIKEYAKKFGEYKLFSIYYTIIQGYQDDLMSIVAYFSKDSIHFKDSLNIVVNPQDIQTIGFIFNIKVIIDNKLVLQKKENDYNELKTNLEDMNERMLNLLKDLKKDKENLTKEKKLLNDRVQKLEKDNLKLTGKINNLELDKMNLSEQKTQLNDIIENMKNDKVISDTRFKNLEDDSLKKDEKIQALETRLDKIDARDTLKMCFKYLYKILKSKFKEVEDTKFFWVQIQEVKKILELPQFSKYSYISKFINDINYMELNPLNFAAHDPDIQDRKISDIKKYLQKYSNEDLNKIVELFESFPFVRDYIVLI